jgi:hypothetical protein
LLGGCSAAVAAARPFGELRLVHAFAPQERAKIVGWHGGGLEHQQLIADRSDNLWLGQLAKRCTQPGQRRLRVFDSRCIVRPGVERRLLDERASLERDSARERGEMRADSRKARATARAARRVAAPPRRAAGRRRRGSTSPFSSARRAERGAFRTA